MVIKAIVGIQNKEEGRDVPLSEAGIWEKQVERSIIKHTL